MIGFFHKALGAETVWWIDDPYSRASYFFAPFIYHANAGAFLNLCLPLAMGLMFAEMGDPARRSFQMVWTIVSVIILAGVLATASKGAVLVTLLLIPLMLIWNGKRVLFALNEFFSDKRRRLERMIFTVFVWLFATTLVILGIENSIKRWEGFLMAFAENSETSMTSRQEMMALMVRMSGPEEGSWHGFGPGSFPHLVPYFTVTPEGEENPIAKGRWHHGHSDPLQTLVEWGYLGAAGWFLLGVGALACGLWIIFRYKLPRHEQPLVRGMMVSILMVGFHSTVDFPLSVYSIHLVTIVLCGFCWGLFARGREPKPAIST
ncbi:O-antigen ligase family protein [Roseibacillus ishigakijimensis]|uniref:O-antigen ligase family protein n=1 Tax=Roseibacillus ishigakijimensis TaxID=454146 RepID=UPI001907DA62|nr:O-antigen ligase family protein [Roseibacillus ishigakijimensis]